jgi:hypothetical protein
MPVNTEAAVSSRPNSSNSSLRGRNLRAAQLRWDRENSSSAAGAEVSNISADAITGVGRGTVVEQAGARAEYLQRGTVGYGSGQIDPRLAAAAANQPSAADTFSVGYGEGQVDPRLAAAAAAADQTTGTPSPSTMQATNGTPAGSSTPSAAARQSSAFTSLSPRPFFRIDPLDNRYDFLTGQKVNTYNSAAIAAGSQPQANLNVQTGGSGAGTGAGTGESGNPGSSDQVFYNEFGDSYTAADRDRVEELRAFNESLGGGGASAQLTDGERAYAISQGYIGGTTTTTAADPNQTGPQ